MKEKYKWIEDMINNQENFCEQDKLAKLYTRVNFLLLTKKYDVINFILENVDVEKAHEALLVVLLRLTYKKRKNFPIWKEMFDKTNNELDKRGVNLELKL
jgi:hypothetical protein